MLVTGVLITWAVLAAIAAFGNAVIIGTGPKKINHTPAGSLLPFIIHITMFVLTIVAIRFG